MISRKYEKLTLLDALKIPEVFRLIFFSFFLHLISNGLNESIIDIDCWFIHKFLCSIFSKGTQPFDFIKRTVIWKLGYKGKYISQINGGLIMFFKNKILLNELARMWTIWKESIPETGAQFSPT